MRLALYAVHVVLPMRHAYQARVCSFVFVCVCMCVCVCVCVRACVSSQRAHASAQEKKKNREGRAAGAHVADHVVGCLMPDSVGLEVVEVADAVLPQPMCQSVCQCVSASMCVRACVSACVPIRHRGSRKKRDKGGRE